MTKKPKSVRVSGTMIQDGVMRMAISMASGSAGKKVKKDWSISTGGTDLIIMVGNASYYMDLTPILRTVLAAEGVK